MATEDLIDYILKILSVFRIKGSPLNQTNRQLLYGEIKPVLLCHEENTLYAFLQKKIELIERS